MHQLPMYKLAPAELHVAESMERGLSISSSANIGLRNTGPRVCVVTGSRADYGLLFWLRAIRRRTGLRAATGRHRNAPLPGVRQHRTRHRKGRFLHRPARRNAVVQRHARGRGEIGRPRRDRHVRRLRAIEAGHRRRPRRPIRDLGRRTGVPDTQHSDRAYRRRRHDRGRDRRIDATRDHQDGARPFRHQPPFRAARAADRRRPRTRPRRRQPRPRQPATPAFARSARTQAAYLSDAGRAALQRAVTLLHSSQNIRRRQMR